MPQDLVFPSFSFVARADMPLLNTGTTSSSTSTSTSTSSTSSSTTSGSTTTTTGSGSLQTTTSKSLTGMPTIVTTSSASTSSLGYTTPSIGVPVNTGNPYIYRTSQPLGTVFIAVGSVVAVILLIFALYHFIKSFAASSLAKKTVNNEKLPYLNLAHHNGAFGAHHRRVLSSTIFANTEYHGSVSKLPLMGANLLMLPMAGPNDSSIALSDTEGPTSRHDLTNMFVSPTKEMSDHRLSNSVSNLSVFGKSVTDVSHVPTSNRLSSTVPNYYMNDSVNNSEYNLAAEAGNARGQGERKPRGTIPSMYLEDLIDQ